MRDSIDKVFWRAPLVLLLLLMACRKDVPAEEDAKIKPPVRMYVVTARMDKKGTNSSSVATAVLKGEYDEQTKVLSYSVDCKDIEPVLITLRVGARGTIGTMVAEIYKGKAELAVKYPLKGSYTLSPLQERNLFKGLWSVAVNSAALSPEISGMLTLKQK